MNQPDSTSPIWISVGIIARNEAEAIGPALESLFAQSLFRELARHGRRAEIFCLANACTDATPEIAAELFARHQAAHPLRHAFTCHALNLKERGKLPAWNRFVHDLSARSAQFLVLMDGDILLEHPGTLWNLCTTLEEHPEAHVAADEPVKDIALKARPTLCERLSLAASRVTQSGGAQLTGQLYCIRAAIAHNIHLPRALAACEDGFIKSLVCTDFVTAPPRPGRVVRARDASHIFEAYLAPWDIVKNQKRQMIGQTYVHVLIDKCLPALSLAERHEMGRTLRRLDERFPTWLERLMADHLRAARHFWRLFPGALTFRWQRWAQLPGPARLAHFPVTLLAWGVTLLACWLAWRALRRGSSDYWPDTRSRRLQRLHPVLPGRSAAHVPLLEARLD